MMIMQLVGGGDICRDDLSWSFLFYQYIYISMKRFVITEDEKNHIQKMYGLINEQATNPVCNRFVMNVPLKNPDPDTGLNWSKNKVLVYSAIYQEPMSGGKLNATDGGGNKVWLQSKGFLDWPAGNTKLAYTAAKKLYDGISGLDISISFLRQASSASS